MADLAWAALLRSRARRAVSAMRSAAALASAAYVVRAQAHVSSCTSCKPNNASTRAFSSSLLTSTVMAVSRPTAALTAAAAARGYSKFAKGAGAAAKYGYRGAHAAGNYPRVYGAVGRAPNVATVRSAVKKMNEAALAARANPTRTNVKQVNNAATRAARLMAQVNNQL